MDYYERQKLARDRLIELGRQVWSLLTDNEQDYYLHRGTLSFVEDIARIVGYDIYHDDEYLLTTITTKIFY